MSFAASAYPVFLANLVTALEAQPAMTDVTVADGPPSAGQLQLRELVLLLDAPYEQEARPLNATTQPRRETFDQECLISVVQKARGAQTAVTLRAFEIFDGFNQALRADPSVGGSVMSAVIDKSGGKILKRIRANDERETAITFRIHVLSKI